MVCADWVKWCRVSSQLRIVKRSGAPERSRCLWPLRRIDQERFGAKLWRTRPKPVLTQGMVAKALLGDMGMFQRGYNLIADELPGFLAELPKIRPDDDAVR